MLLIIQTTNERNTSGNPAPWLGYTLLNGWCDAFSFLLALPDSLHHVLWKLVLRPSGCPAFLSSSEMRIFSAPCVHHFILIHINLMLWEFRNSPIYDLPPCHWYLEIDFLHAYGRFSNLWCTIYISNQCGLFFVKWDLRPLKSVNNCS